ncbi:hypothetical protein MASR2M50_05370 [Thauera sp.]
MRTQLRNMLASIGIDSPQFAISATMAMRRLRAEPYDLILSEYDLGEGQDGQHLLEDLRQHDIIPPETVFVMITGERNYERVISACELVPNDYILKPLTAESLRVRLLRAFEKRDAFLPVWQLMKLGDPVGALAACHDARDRHPQYLVDFMRLQAELHAQVGQIDEAAALYREILAARPIPWASLGLARMLVMREAWVEAEHLLVELVARHPRFIEAHELLARVQEETGRPAEACETLQRATELSPYRLPRLRRLGELALQAGNSTAPSAAWPRPSAAAAIRNSATPRITSAWCRPNSPANVPMKPWPRSPTSSAASSATPRANSASPSATPSWKAIATTPKGCAARCCAHSPVPSASANSPPGCAATCSSFATSANSKAKAASCSPT